VKKAILIVSIFTLLIILGGLVFIFLKKPELISPLPSIFSRQTDYTPYSFENLKKRQYYQSEIRLEEVLKEETNYTSYLFSYAAEGKRITGMANIPKKEGQLPVAILLRGWVDEKEYYTGLGSEKMANFLAENGFLTLAPDFLGYGDSAADFSDMLQARFFRPVTVISLLSSLDSLEKADKEKVVIWGHSNGGQIALSVLEITEKNIPTSLWAPVSAPFPESILHYTDELEDKGALVKKIVAEFEEKYDPSFYSTTTYLNLIKAPLIIHQGTADEAIPLEWTENLIGELKKLDKEVTYYQYPGENHNFNFGSAPLARERDLNFFLKMLK
jgi:dienelactone hydrolase